jgi:hypothetical protein
MAINTERFQFEKNPPTTRIEPVSHPEQRAAAEERRRKFPFRFPADRRRLGGKFTVAENSRRLLRFFYLERRLAQGLGSWTLQLNEFEVKVETGRHIFWHADAASKLRERLSEQEKRPDAIDQFRDEGVDRLIDEMLSAADSPELLVGVHRVLGRAIETAYRHHMDDTCPIADAPTIRLLNQILLDYRSMLDWAEKAIQAYLDGGVEESRLANWEWHLNRLLGSIGGVTGADPVTAAPEPLRSVAKPYERGTFPARDSRFNSFSNTGDYNVADGTPRYPVNTYEDERLRFIRAQRDEVDAIEAFGTFLWDVRFKDFKAEYDLARITWDETRHTEMGHRTLQILGYDPFELPNRQTTSICRGAMKEPEYGFMEINLFGEVGVLKTINGLIDHARKRNDSAVAHVSDFIRSDERTHVRKGQYILQQMTKTGMEELEVRTRELFTECLVSLGAWRKDINLMTMTREEIERYVWE